MTENYKNPDLFLLVFHKHDNTSESFYYVSYYCLYYFYSYSFFCLRILQLCSPFFVTKNSDFHLNFPLCSRYQRRNRKCENAARQIHACNFTPHLSARKVTLATSRLAWSWKRFQSTLPAGGNDVPPLPCIK